MILRSSPPSPFGRKVKIAAALLGLSDRIEVVLADTNDPTEELRRQNPLGKIPTLILDDGTTLFDSRVIVDYLDDLAGGGGIIPRGPKRYAALRLQALADGIMDASLLRVYEGRFRPAEKHEPQWLTHQEGKVTRGLAALEAEPPSLAEGIDIGHIALACALGYLDLRFARTWREDHPRLVEWLTQFEAAVPAYAATRVAS